MTMSELASFRNPPLVETVLGVQFTSVKAFTMAHVGLFWRDHLAADGWCIQGIEMPLETRVETMDSSGIWVPTGTAIVPVPFPQGRVQIVDRTGQRMLQVQDSWLLFNWRKQEASYPSYELLVPEFLTHFAAFQDFVADNALGEVRPRQWEVTYVNHIKKGTVWNQIADWNDVFPGALDVASRFGPGEVESLNASWSILLDGARGRLRASLRHVRLSPEEAEAIDFRLTTRGPLSTATPKDVQSALDVGHEAIVRTFAGCTSAQAHAYWGRR